MKRIGPGNARSTLAALDSMDRGALVERWETFYGCAAPRHAQATLLKGALAWECQRVLQPRIGRVLRASSKALGAGGTSRTRPPGPGTRLLREWQGVTHRVTVVSDGFEYNGALYRSLTAIARRITGTPWSGPLFFGLRR